MSEIKVREYQPEDAPAVEQCLLELQEDSRKLEPHFWTAPENIKGVYLPALIREMAEESGKIFVLEAEGRVRGMVAVDVAGKGNSPDIAIKEYGHVVELAVLREEKGKGYGAKLLKKAEDFIKSQGIEWMQLNVIKGNTAVDFYKKAGYRERSIRMEKKLT